MVIMERSAVDSSDNPPSGQEIPPQSADGPEPQEAPRRRGRPPGSKNRTTGAPGSPRRASLESRVRGAIAGVVAFGNNFLAGEPDPLTDEEMTALTEAATVSALQSQRIVKWLEKTSGPMSHAMLILVLAQISIPRLARRNLIPFVRFNNANSDTAGASSVPLDARGASGDNRGHEFGQDHAGEFSPPISEVHNFH